MAEPKKHAELSPSTAPRYLNCPGSVELCRGVPDQRSQYADEGEMAHRMAEKLLDGSVQFKDIGNVFENSAVPHDMPESVMLFVKECQEDQKTAIYVGIEQTVSLDWLWHQVGRTPPTPMYGTADWIALLPNLLKVRDYKHGAGVFVPILDNEQLMKYGLGAMQWCLDAGFVLPSKVEISITQPRSRSGGQHTRSETYHVMDLLSWAERVLIPGAEKAWNDKGQTLNPGPWCKKTFCRARRTCPALHQMAVQTAQGEFQDMTLRGAAGRPFLDPSRLTDTALGDALNKAEIFADGINEFVKACRAEASARIDRGATVPNWKLVEKRANRTWKLGVARTVEWLDKNTRVPAQDFTENKILSVAAAERLLKPTGKKLQDLPGWGDFIEKKSTGSTLVPDTDPREMVESGPVADFDPWEEG